MTVSPRRTVSLAARLAHLPSQPGVYLMKGRNGEILYIGKARVLADRVRSYFQQGRDPSPKTRALVALVHDVETMIARSELEALLLESNLVKRHRPRFNVVLRDDKHYPYLRLPVKDDFPRLSIVRRVQRDGALYFGPYVPTGALRETLKVIKKVFPLATCTIDIDGTADRACLEFEIKRCMAPCTGNQSREDYHRIVNQVRCFLEGRDRELLEGLRRDMDAAAAREDFEDAARLRDRAASVSRTLEKQRVAQIGPVDQDVIGLARRGRAADVQLLFVRGGLLIGRRDFFWGETQGVSDEELIRSTIEQFYHRDTLPPGELLVPAALSGQALLQRWLTHVKGRRVRIVAPARGTKFHLLHLAGENAEAALDDHVRTRAAKHREARDVQRLLGLPNTPGRVEGFDISNTMGAQSVASMVAWEDGAMKKADYRRFRVRTVEGANDFASIHEVVTRRYGGSLASASREGGTGRDGGGVASASQSVGTGRHGGGVVSANRKGGTGQDGGGVVSANRKAVTGQDGDGVASASRKALLLPDLILIDGGPGQLGAAMDALRALGLGHLPVIGFAKAKGDKDERVYVPGHRAPRILPASPGAHLLQRIRDEAHRFAITYHRKLRGKAFIVPESKKSSGKRKNLKISENVSISNDKRV